MDHEYFENLRLTLIQCGKSFETSVLFPTVIPQASELVVTDPYAFAVAACLDRGAKAEIIWTIPYDIKTQLGHLNPEQIHKLSIKDLEALFVTLPRRPRYVNDAPRTIKDLTRIVVEECDGDAAQIWNGKRAAQVKRTFQSIHGVGEGIANMAVLLIEAAFNVRFSDLDRKNMDIKADVHTMRVLYRLGISPDQTEQAAMQAARRISPNYPGEIDGALWNIGRTWCHATRPVCSACCLEPLCTKRIR